MTIPLFLELSKEVKGLSDDIDALEPRGGLGLFADYWCPQTAETTITVNSGQITNANNRVQCQPFTVAAVVAFDRFAVDVAAGAAAARYLAIGIYDFDGNKLWDHFLECVANTPLVSTAGVLYTLFPGTYLIAYSHTNTNLRFLSWDRIQAWREINNIVFTDLLSFFGANAMAGAPPIMPTTIGARTTNDNIANSRQPVAVLFDGT